jgi:hypothetical protein
MAEARRALFAVLGVAPLLVLGCSSPDSNVGYGGEVRKNEKAAAQMDGRPPKQNMGAQPSLD